MKFKWDADLEEFMRMFRILILGSRILHPSPLNNFSTVVFWVVLLTQIREVSFFLNYSWIVNILSILLNLITLFFIQKIDIIANRAAFNLFSQSSIQSSKCNLICDYCVDNDYELLIYPSYFQKYSTCFRNQDQLCI